jgi:iron complex outermembrane receptor protein
MQLLFCPKENFNITLSGDLTRQRPDGYAQVYAGSVTTQRETFRQFEKIIADLNYSLPSQNPFDRLIDHETPWRSDQDMGGVSLNIDLKSRRGTFTSTTAWRKWIWNPSNDRDYTGLQALALSQAPSIHNQWSQEVRFAGNFNKKLSGVVGVFGFFQELEANGFHREESGRDQWRFVQTSQSALWQTPGLLNGYGIKTKPSFRNFSGAIFSQIDWSLNQKISILPGVRLNYDQKFVDFRREVYGGLQTSDTTLLALQRTVYNNQYFNASINDWNVSGQLTVNFNVNDWIRFYVTNSVGIKPIGLNLGGLPTQNGEPIIDLAVIKPEKAYHFEIGIKTEPSKSSFVNFTIFNTDIYNYQALVQSPQLGVNRGYLANAEHVRTRGIELEASYAYSKILRVVGSLIYTDGKYVSFQNAPLPLEETGQKVNGVQVAFKDISGGKLPGISTWSFSTGFESTIKGELIGQQGDYFFAADLFYRSPFSSSPSPSKYLNINGYFLVNARIGFRTQKGLTIYIWTRNLANINYFEQLLPAAGNAGQFAAVLGDPRTYGITLRFNFF